MKFSTVKFLLRYPHLSGPALSISKKFFKNTSGLDQNVRGRVRKFRSRRQDPWAPKRSSEIISLNAKRLRDTGILFAPSNKSGLIKQPLQAYESIMNSLVREKNLLPLSEDTRNFGKYYTISSELNLDDAIAAFVSSDLLETVACYFGSRFTVHSGLFSRIDHVPSPTASSGEVFSNYWHCDSQCSNHVALFILLSDVTSDHGPTHVLNRMETKKNIKRGYNRRTGKNVWGQKEIEGEKVFIGRAGDCLLLETWNCFHRASIPKKGKTRDMMVITFESVQKSTKKRVYP